MFCWAKGKDASAYLKNGNKLYQSYLQTKDKEQLDEAYRNYYKATEIMPTSSSYLGMGMILLEKDMDKKAKTYLYKAYSVDETDSVTNYYLAKYFEKQEDYLKALIFYKKACEFGLADNYDVNYSIGAMYEKVGDFSLAKRYYQTALKLNPTSEEIQNRLSVIEVLERNKSLYGVSAEQE